MIHLRAPTPDAWQKTVMGDLDAFLIDHAACERKASAMALHMVAHYRDRKVLVDAMVEFACEELEHFRQVYAWLDRRGLQLGADTRDEYVNQLNQHNRKGSDLYFLDRLLIAGIIEARGCERFGLVAAALPEGELKDFYLDITRAEARHHGLFLRLAREYFDEASVAARLAELLDREGEIMLALPLRPALH